MATGPSFMFGLVLAQVGLRLLAAMTLGFRVLTQRGYDLTRGDLSRRRFDVAGERLPGRVPSHAVTRHANAVLLSPRWRPRGLGRRGK